MSPSVLGTTLSPLWSVLLISSSFISFVFSLVFLSFHTSVNTFKFLAKSLIYPKKLWCVITQLSQNRSHRCSSSFLLYFFKHTGWNTFVHTYFSKGKSASYSWHATKKTHERLQKTCLTKYEIVIKDDYLRS